jgi:hypothetical protein
LGANEATLTFTGRRLTPGDFDALSEFVMFAKKQFERKTKAEVSLTFKPIAPGLKIDPSTGMPEE